MKLIADLFRRNPADRHYWKGVEYQKKGLYSEAREEYLKAIENDPGYHKAYTNLGSLVMKSAGTIGPDMILRITEARDYFLKALEIKPDSATALYNLGTISYMYADNEGEAF
jgi:tetratricopeptide (TPR) repeat protein